MSRERNHIFKIMTFLFKLWLKYPELRFCQLIKNAFKHNEDIYYIKDSELLKRLKRNYKKGLKNDKKIR